MPSMDAADELLFSSLDVDDSTACLDDDRTDDLVIFALRSRSRADAVRAGLFFFVVVVVVDDEDAANGEDGAEDVDDGDDGDDDKAVADADDKLSAVPTRSSSPLLLFDILTL